MVIFILLAVVFLTYSNGANDNFKGVATLWGSGTLNYPSALSIATIATFAGSVCSYTGLSGDAKTRAVSVGSIYGIGLANKSANHKEILKISLSWVLTLPIAGVFSAIIFFAIT